MKRVLGVVIGLFVAAIGCGGSDEERGLVWVERAPLQSDGQALAVVGDGSLVGAGESGLFASNDQGQTWQPLAATGFPPGHVVSMTSTDDDSLLAYVWGHGLFGSDDAGSTWSALGDLPLDPLLSVATSTRAPMVPYVLAADPQNESHIVGAGPGGLSATEDGALTWQSVSVPGGVGKVNILFTGAAVIGDTMYATAQLPVGILPPLFLQILAGGVYVSRNRGES